jgi:outer membrane lipoprotein-sorting protein
MRMRVILLLLAGLTLTIACTAAGPGADKETAFRRLEANANAMQRVSLNI